MGNGQPFGSRYLLDEPLGRGAMGRVYRARVRDSDDIVAVKVLRDDLSSQADVVARFVQERQVLRSISHPNVVAVHDLVVEGDQLGIVMDLVSGGDLRSAVRFPVPAHEALTMVRQIASGLAAVHAAGVIHRDLKPENVLVDRSDGIVRLRLTDFGVSRLVGQTLTKVTSLIGTPGYLAPEVAEGKSPTPAADVYALGVLFFEMLTGRPPFVVENVMALLRAHAEAEVPRPIGMPDDLWALVAGMLAKAPEERVTTDQILSTVDRLMFTLGPIGPFEVGETAGTVVRPRRSGEFVSGGFGGADSPTLMRPSSSSLPPPSSPPPAPPAPPTPHKKKRSPMAIVGAACAFTLVIGGVTALVLKKTSSVASAESTIYAFLPVSYTGGTVVTRQWELVGPHGDLLRSTIVLTNAGKVAATGDHFEVIPKAVATDVKTIKFEPAPDEIVASDPVVRYSLAGLAPGQQETVKWEVTLPSGQNTPARMQDLAAKAQAATDEFAATSDTGSNVLTLKSIALDPSALSLDIGQSAKVGITGLMSDGSAAPAEVLSGVAWTSSDPTIATVDQSGSVAGASVGATSVTAQAGDVSSTVAVTVNGTGTSGSATTSAPAPVTTAPKVTTPPKTTSQATAPPTTLGVPSAPTALKLTAGFTTSNSIGVSWAAPASNGGGAISGYTVTAKGTGYTQTKTTAAGVTTATFESVPYDTVITGTVTATNGQETSPAASGNVTSGTTARATGINVATLGTTSVRVLFSLTRSLPGTTCVVILNGSGFGSPCSGGDFGGLPAGTTFSVIVRVSSPSGQLDTAGPNVGTAAPPPTTWDEIAWGPPGTTDPLFSAGPGAGSVAHNAVGSHITVDCRAFNQAVAASNAGGWWYHISAGAFAGYWAPASVYENGSGAWPATGGLWDAAVRVC